MEVQEETQDTPTPLPVSWPQVIAFFERITGKPVPDLNAMLFLVGMQELGFTRTFSKEEKQDVLHIGTCAILATRGHYRRTHTDGDGWPHYEVLTPPPMLDGPTQERYLQAALAAYLQPYLADDAG